MEPITFRELGQVAYDAFVEQIKHVMIFPLPPLTWAELGDSHHAVWRAVAESVLRVQEARKAGINEP